MSQLEPRTTLSRLMPEAAPSWTCRWPRRHPPALHPPPLRAGGRSVFQAGKRGADAAAEIQQLLTELFDHG
jgi:chromosome partitioning protein